MQELETKKKDIVSFFLKKGLLLSSDLLKQLDNDPFFEEVSRLIDNTEHEEITVLNEKIKELLGQSESANLNWPELEKYDVISEKKGKSGYENIVRPLLQGKTEPEEQGSKVNVIFSYKSEPNGFVPLFV